MKITESNVQRSICDFLAAKRVRFHRMNAGDRFGETNGRKWRIKGHEKGCADPIEALCGARIEKPKLFVEWAGIYAI